jgi:hypothetical protein
MRNQFDIAWALTSYHLDGLTTEECLWRPARVGLHVHQDTDGVWRADWPDREGYDIGPAEHRVGDLAHQFLVVDGAESLVRRRHTDPGKR